jgi:preprotein translocase subunit SecY
MVPHGRRGLGRLTAVGGALLAFLVAAGTALYVAGAAPPYPWNARLFNLLLAVSIAYALAFGRARR